MFSKIIKIFVVSIIIYYIIGLLLYPLQSSLQSLQNNNPLLSALVGLAVFVIELLLALFISTKFFILKIGEGKKLALALFLLNLAFGIIGIFSNSLLVAKFNSLSGGQASAPNIYLSGFVLVIKSALLYSLAWIVLTKYEDPILSKSNM